MVELIKLILVLAHQEFLELVVEEEVKLNLLIIVQLLQEDVQDQEDQEDQTQQEQQEDQEVQDEQEEQEDDDDARSQESV